VGSDSVKRDEQLPECSYIGAITTVLRKRELSQGQSDRVWRSQGWKDGEIGRRGRREMAIVIDQEIF
jgi:hypothetical protein